jgi:hypothetical protein
MEDAGLGVVTEMCDRHPAGAAATRFSHPTSASRKPHALPEASEGEEGDHGDHGGSDDADGGGQGDEGDAGEEQSPEEATAVEAPLAACQGRKASYVAWISLHSAPARTSMAHGRGQSATNRGQAK